MSKSLKYHKKAHTNSDSSRFIQQITWVNDAKYNYIVGVRVNEAD